MRERRASGLAFETHFPNTSKDAVKRDEFGEEGEVEVSRPRVAKVFPTCPQKIAISRFLSRSISAGRGPIWTIDGVSERHGPHESIEPSCVHV